MLAWRRGTATRGGTATQAVVMDSPERTLPSCRGPLHPPSRPQASSPTRTTARPSSPLVRVCRLGHFSGRAPFAEASLLRLCPMLPGRLQRPGPKHALPPLSRCSPRTDDQDMASPLSGRNGTAASPSGQASLSGTRAAGPPAPPLNVFQVRHRPNQPQPALQSPLAPPCLAVPCPSALRMPTEPHGCPIVDGPRPLPPGRLVHGPAQDAGHHRGCGRPRRAAWGADALRVAALLAARPRNSCSSSATAEQHQ
jgi:hypothetical protein